MRISTAQESHFQVVPWSWCRLGQSRHFNRGNGFRLTAAWGRNRGVDISAEEMMEPLVDLGIHTWYTLYPSRGLRRPRAKREHEQSENQRLR
ncbi:hypothetical protein LWI29_028174 [Acer saccharum]|uniref:Uncharacterized protein n=1 Tax=Acer saccharum TaxID=4024 RepID=A0AA39W074_ACESA|nr:hypothetical protein LWI29_028174 [Acer saccharum]